VPGQEDRRRRRLGPLYAFGVIVRDFGT
jgi:hypothetical protein